jgi:hypothetical protein
MQNSKEFKVGEIFETVFVGLDPSRISVPSELDKQQEHELQAWVIKNSDLNVAELEVVDPLERIRVYDCPLLKKYRLNSSDLLVTSRFKEFWCALTGKVSESLCVPAPNLFVLRGVKEMTSSEYIGIYLRSKSGIQRIRTIARPVNTKAPTFKGWCSINCKDLIELRIPIPSQEQQCRVIEQFHDISALCQKQKAEMSEKLNKFNQLFGED